MQKFRSYNTINLVFDRIVNNTDSKVQEFYEIYHFVFTLINYTVTRVIRQHKLIPQIPIWKHCCGVSWSDSGGCCRFCLLGGVSCRGLSRFLRAIAPRVRAMAGWLSIWLHFSWIPAQRFLTRHWPDGMKQIWAGPELDPSFREPGRIAAHGTALRSAPHDAPAAV